MYACSREIPTSKRRRATKARERVRVKRPDDREKNENMYSMMWPEERFVLRRIIRVKGRIR